jgi:hypothetical protein
MRKFGVGETKASLGLGFYVLGCEFWLFERIFG